MLRSHTGVSAVPSLIHSPPFGARSSARLERIPDKDEVGSSSLPGPTRPFPASRRIQADPLTPAGRRHADYRSDISGLERAERAAGGVSRASWARRCIRPLVYTHLAGAHYDTAATGGSMTLSSRVTRVLVLVLTLPCSRLR